MLAYIAPPPWGIVRLVELSKDWRTGGYLWGDFPIWPFEVSKNEFVSGSLSPLVIGMEILFWDYDDALSGGQIIALEKGLCIIATDDDIRGIREDAVIHCV